MASTWAGILEVTTEDFIREVEDAIIRDRKLLAMLQARGRITFNHSGTQMNWKVKFRRALPKGYGDLDVQTYPRRNRHKTAKLGWRAYALAESISKFDRLQNRGTPAIVNLMDEKMRTLAEDMDDFYSEELYVDGNASGNEKRMHGIESMFGTSGASTVQPIANPSDTYANLNTDLGYYGGSWTVNNNGVSTWPTGKGSAEYDFYSPLLVDYTSAVATVPGVSLGWTAATKTWANTCSEALRYGITNSRKNKGKAGQVDAVMLERELYRQWVEFQSAKERLVVNMGGGGNGTSMTALGFGDNFMFEGAEITSEFGMPADTGYGWNLDHMEICSMQDRLFVPNGPYENEVDKSIRFDVDFFGNAKFDSPKWFMKLKNYS